MTKNIKTAKSRSRQATKALQAYLDDPAIGRREEASVARAIRSGFVSTFGPFVHEFEKQLSGFLGVPKALALQSGTAAIHMALRELGVGPGDEVIVPAITFSATVNPVLYCGATPVFADVDPKTWNIDARQLKSLLTPKTRAVICVHLYGNPCEMDALLGFAREHGLWLIEDATESLGATYRRQMTGTFGDMGCFSFNGNKLITTGGGGLLVAREVERLSHIRYLINQAKAMEGREGFAEMGFNYRMTNLAAALGLAQFSRVKGFLTKKRKIFQSYQKALSGIANVHFQEETPGGQSSWWLTSVVLSGGLDAGRAQKALAARGVPSRRIFEPLYQLKAYQSYARGPLPVAERLYQQGLNLPSSCVNTDCGIRCAGQRMKEVFAL